MSAGDIVVVDYHKGNLQSVVRGINAVGGSAVASDDPRAISEASGVVLPGVGAFADAMAFLRQSGQADAITACFSEYSRRVLKRSKSQRVPIREQLKRAAAELARQPSRKKERAREAVHEDR